MMNTQIAPRLFAPVFALLLAVTSPTAALALGAPAPDLWDRWTAHDPGSSTTVDHEPWNRFLARHLVAGDDGVNRIAYGRVDATDRAALKAYIAGLAATPVSGLSRAEQMPYWINLYNALTVDVVLDHHPVASIRDIDISPGFFADGPWGRKLLEIEREQVSLDDIEHRILRPIWRDPRIHYAVNCAALGCPNLMPQAFTADTIEAMLDAGARAFVNHPRGARVDGGRLVVSSIYQWFDEDFGGNDAGVIAHLRQYAEPPLAASLNGTDRIYDDAYDWSLNEVP